MRRLAVLVLSLSLSQLSPRGAEACATAPPRWSAVSVDREDVLLVWDAARHTEHFVRRVDFQSRGAPPDGKTDEGFGFLVPTPTQPELREASDAVFDRLEALTTAEIVQEPSYSVIPGCAGPFLWTRMAGVRATTSAPGVHVLGVERVAGLDATILEATDASALEKWLLEHDYAFRPALKKWVTPYIDAKWKITAFKYARATAAQGRAPAGVLTSHTLRMSFTTERPFYPYREPEDAVVRPARALRLFVLSDKRLEGNFALGGSWPGTVMFARPDLELKGVRDAVPGANLEGTSWLTESLDFTTRRVADDVYFKPEASQAKLVRAPLVLRPRREVFIPVELIVLGSAAILFLRSRRRRKQVG